MAQDGVKLQQEPAKQRRHFEVVRPQPAAAAATPPPRLSPQRAHDDGHAHPPPMSYLQRRRASGAPADLNFIERAHARRAALSRSPSPDGAAVSPSRGQRKQQQQPQQQQQTLEQLYAARPTDLQPEPKTAAKAAEVSGAATAAAAAPAPQSDVVPSQQQHQEYAAAGAKGRRKSLLALLSKKVRSKFDSSVVTSRSEVLDHAPSSSGSCASPGRSRTHRGSGSGPGSARRYFAVGRGHAAHLSLDSQVDELGARFSILTPAVAHNQPVDQVDVSLLSAGGAEPRSSNSTIHQLSFWRQQSDTTPVAAANCGSDAASPVLVEGMRACRVDAEPKAKTSSASSGYPPSARSSSSSFGASAAFGSGNRRFSFPAATTHQGTQLCYMRVHSHSGSSSGDNKQVYMLTDERMFVTAYEMMRLAHERPSVSMCAFLRTKQCYELVPNSTKLVIFDTQLPVRKAFFALVYNGVRAAPLWDSSARKFIGMLTITDFIRILHRYYKGNSGVLSAADQATSTEPDTKPLKPGGGITELETHKISTWREVLDADGVLRPFASIDASESLYKAVKMLCQQRMQNFPRADYMEKTPRQLNIGCWENIITVNQWTPVIDALSVFLQRRVSAVPVVDASGAVVDIYAKFDALNLAAEHTYNLLGNTTVAEALKHREAWFEGVAMCSDQCSLGTVMERLVRAEVHRMVVADKDNKPIGLISLSDILHFFVLDNDVEQYLASSASSAAKPKRHSASSLSDIKCTNAEPMSLSTSGFEAVSGAAVPQISPQPVHLGAGPKRLFETQPVGAHETILDVEHEHDHDHDHDHEHETADSDVKCQA